MTAKASAVGEQGAESDDCIAKIIKLGGSQPSVADALLRTATPSARRLRIAALVTRERVGQLRRFVHVAWRGRVRILLQR
jgi:hypothetical protein